jgi:hypothetical protein
MFLLHVSLVKQYHKMREISLVICMLVSLADFVFILQPLVANNTLDAPERILLPVLSLLGGLIVVTVLVLCLASCIAVYPGSSLSTYEQAQELPDRRNTSHGGLVLGQP